VDHIISFNFYGALIGFLLFLTLLILSNRILRMVGLGRPGEGYRGVIDREEAARVDLTSVTHLESMAWRRRIKFALWLLTLTFGIVLIVKVGFMLSNPMGHGVQQEGDQDHIARPEMREVPPLKPIARPNWEEQKKQFRDGTF
jgi:hypothetical protein